MATEPSYRKYAGAGLLRHPSHHPLSVDAGTVPAFDSSIGIFPCLWQVKAHSYKGKQAKESGYEQIGLTG